MQFSSIFSSLGRLGSDLLSLIRQPDLYTHTHTRTHARTHAHMHARTHTHTRICIIAVSQPVRHTQSLVSLGIFFKAGLHSGAGPLASDSHLDNVHLQEAAMATSVMAIHVKAPQLNAKLCQVSHSRSHLSPSSLALLTSQLMACTPCDLVDCHDL